MLRLHSEALSPDWFEFLVSLVRDLDPLGHFARVEVDGAFTIGTSIPLNDFPSLSVDMATFQPSAVGLGEIPSQL
jgi:hypothetical protein